MPKKTYKTIKNVEFYSDSCCKTLATQTKHDLRIYPNHKGVIINYYGGVFGMPYQSNKNMFSRIFGSANEYYYSIVCQGKRVYFKLTHNLYDFETLQDNVEYQSIKAD